MLKKTISAVIASAFALTLAVPLATACPAHEAKNKDEKGQIAKEDTAQPDKDQKDQKKVARADKKQAKKKDKAPQE